jgi:hypothetical protein
MQRPVPTPLERSLLQLGRELDVPEPPDVVTAVSARLGRRPRPSFRWRAALAVALVALAVLAATLAIPDARSALLRILHIGGERIELVDELPSIPPTGDLESTLGARISLADTRRMLGPGFRELDERPDRVYVDAVGTVWFLYGTPERARLLVAQTPHLALDRGLTAGKLVGPGTRVDDVSVDGSRGLFLSGAPHLVGLVGRNGAVVAETVHLARDVLVWSSGGVTYRLEGDFTRDEALRLAGSLHR